MERYRDVSDTPEVWGSRESVLRELGLHPGHLKMEDLAGRLQIPIYAAVGSIEILWH
jgi:hypothetical protein